MTKNGLPEHLQYLENVPLDVLKAIDGAGQVAQSLERQSLEGDVSRLNILETPFYDRLGKVQATAYEHEYNLVTSRHDKLGYAAYKDGGVPRSVDVEVARRRTLPTLIGHRITITELAVATTRAGVQTAEETARTEKIVAVMEETENLLFNGDRRFGSTDLDSPQNLQFDGMVNIVKRGAPMNITDAAGSALSINMLWAAENKVYQTQGMARPNVVYVSPIDKINLQQAFYQVARTMDSRERAAGILGADAQSYISAFGETEIVTSRFLGDFEKFSDIGFGNTGGEFARPAPIASFSGNATGAATDGLVADTYSYQIKTFNFNGESAAVEIDSPVVATDGDKITLTLTGVADNVKGFIIYRKDASTDGEFKFFKRVPHYSGGGATIEDDGHETLVSPYGSFTYRKLPGTGHVVGVDHVTTSMAQWIPLEQVPLPQILNRDLAIRHVSSLFSRAPEFNFLIVNVGQDSLAK